MNQLNSQPRRGPRSKALGDGMLDHGVAGGQCAGLVLVASNPFLGHLKARLGEQAHKATLRTVPADDTALREDELAQRLRSHQH